MKNAQICNIPLSTMLLHYIFKQTKMKTFKLKKLNKINKAWHVCGRGTIPGIHLNNTVLFEPGPKEFQCSTLIMVLSKKLNMMEEKSLNTEKFGYILIIQINDI